MKKLVTEKKDSSKSRIFLVEDHPIFRESLAKMLDAESDFVVCGMAGSAGQALKAIVKLKPDLAIVDLGLPDKTGLELIREIRGFKLAIKLLVVSMFDESLYAQRVLRAGGDGYIMKQEDPEEIVHAVRDVLAGRIYVSEHVFAKDSSKPPTETVAGALDELSDSELVLLEMLGQGKSTVEISRQLDFSKSEVDQQSQLIQQKLKLKNLNALIRFAVGWVENSC